MKQSWQDLLFAHWPVSVEALRPLIPAKLEIETFDGTAWLGIVPFRRQAVHEIEQEVERRLQVLAGESPRAGGSGTGVSA